MTMPPQYHGPALSPATPRRASVLPWVLVVVVAVLVFGGLAALFASRGPGGEAPGTTEPPVQRPSAAVPSAVDPSTYNTEWPPQEKYPTEVLGWTMSWSDGLADYISPDGTKVMLVLPWGRSSFPLEKEVELMTDGPIAEPQPDIFCYDVPDAHGDPYRICLGATRSGELVSAGAPYLDFTDAELAAWTRALLDSVDF